MQSVGKPAYVVDAVPRALQVVEIVLYGGVYLHLLRVEKAVEVLVPHLQSTALQVEQN